jgi:c-di-GMP-related signal transduction protein
VNFTRSLLVGDYYRMLPTGGIVIELLEDIEPDDEVLAACDRLKAAGTRWRSTTSPRTTSAWSGCWRMPTS